MAFATSSAGCLSLLPPVGQQVRYGRVDVPNAIDTDPRYREWIPASDELPDVETERDIEDMHWVSVAPKTLDSAELGSMFGIGTGLVLSRMDYVGYEFAHYEYVHSNALGSIAEGDIDRETVAETLLDGGYSRDGTYHDWDMFDRTDMPRAVAVSDSAVVRTQGEHRRKFLETLADAGDGRIERRHEADERFERFTERVGMYPEMIEQFGYNFSPVEPEYATMAFTFEDDGIYYTQHQQFADGETPSRGEIEQFLEEEHERAARAWAVDIEIEDTFVRTEMHMSEEEAGADSPNDRQPHVMWGVEESGETVTIQLEAGDSIPVDQLQFDPQSVLVEEFASGTILEPGDGFTLDFSAEGGTMFLLIYQYAHSEHSEATILQYTPDELDTE
jgi:hypothetical protein